MSYAPGREQIPVVTTSLEAIMSRPAFAVGVDDYRAGQPMRDLGAEMGTDLPIDEYREMVNAQWDYERGRHWAAIAPRNMPVRIQGKLNRAAVEIALLQYGDFI